METEIPVAHLVGFLLALVRTSAWMATSPPFNTRLVSRYVKLGVAAGISFVLAPKIPADQVTLEAGPLMVMVVTQIVTGLALGFLTQLVFAAVSAAGSLIDMFGGFTLSQSFDPLLNNQTSVFGRFYQLLATTLLFVTSGHLMLIKGFMTSFEAVPLGGVEFDNFKELLLKDMSMFLLSAVEIAGPLLVAYFLTEVALGLLSKAAPQLNILTFGLPLKILLTLMLVAAAVPLVPGAVETLVNHSIRDGVALLGAGAGR